MTSAKYSFQGLTESMAKAMKRDAELSFKVAIEISSFLKGKTTSNAKTILERVLLMKQPIPYKRFKGGVGHRKGAGISVGRYPQKGAAIFMELIKSAEANAQAKGLSTELKIIHLAAQKSSGAFHSGRSGRRKFKRSHLEIVVQEMEKDSKKESKQSTKKEQKESSETEQKNQDHEQKLQETTTAKKEITPKKKKVVKKAQEDKQ